MGINEKKMNRLLLKNYSVKTHNKITNDHYIFLFVFLRGKAVNKANRLKFFKKDKK